MDSSQIVLDHVCDFIQDHDRTICIAFCKYIKRLAANNVKLFGFRTNATITQNGDLPELDGIELIMLT